MANIDQIKNKPQLEIALAEVPSGGSALAGGRALARTSVRKSLRDSASVRRNERRCSPIVRKNLQGCMVQKQADGTWWLRFRRSLLRRGSGRPSLSRRR